MMKQPVCFIDDIYILVTSILYSLEMPISGVCSQTFEQSQWLYNHVIHIIHVKVQPGARQKCG